MILYYESRLGESFKLSSFDRKIENRKLMSHYNTYETKNYSNKNH